LKDIIEVCKNNECRKIKKIKIDKRIMEKKIEENNKRMKRRTR